MERRVSPIPRTTLHRERSADPWLRAGIRVWTIIGVLILIWVLGIVAQFLRPLLVTTVIAIVLIVVLDPLVRLFVRRGLARVLGTVLAYLLLIVVLIFSGWLIVPGLAGQISGFVSGLPSTVEQLENYTETVAARFGMRIDVAIDGAAIQEWLTDPENRETILGYVGGVGTATASVVRAVFFTILGPVLAFYVLADLPRITRGLMSLVPADRRAEYALIASRCSWTVGAFLRGQMVVALFVGVASAVALWAINLRFWLVVGVIAGVTNLIPFIGPIVGGIVAVTIALFTGSPVLAIWATVVILVVQQLESHLVAPLVVGRAVRLPALVIVLAVLVGGMSAGLVGMLVAVPVAASIRVILEHVRREEAGPAEQPAPP